jgi:hypothetical protein
MLYRQAASVENAVKRLARLYLSVVCVVGFVTAFIVK